MGRLKGSISKSNKIKLYVHYDADGVACAVLFKSVYGDLVDINFTSTPYIDDSIRKWLSNPTNTMMYNQIAVADLSVTEPTAKLMEQSGLSLVLLDHHDTVDEYVKNAEWSSIIPDVSQCGATLTHQYLKKVHYNDEQIMKVLTSYDKFVRAVHHYDCWLWEDLNERVPYELNQLLYIIGRKRFLERFLYDASVPDERNSWGTDETVLLALDKERCNRYIYGRKFHYSEQVIDGLNVGIVPGDMYINDLSHSVLEDHPSIDAVAVVAIENSSVSFRSRSGSDADVASLAKKLGGGGHINSAGARIDDKYYTDMFSKFISDNLNKEDN